jgi:hypothetical protein
VAGAAALCVAFTEIERRAGRAPFVANALTAAAKPFSSNERVSAREQGGGFVHVPDALRILSRGGAGVSPRLDPADPLTAHASLARGAVSAASPFLVAGETFDAYVEIPRGTGEIRMVFPEVRHVGLDNPVFGGDALQLTVHSAKRGGTGDYVFRDGTLQSGDSFEWPFPEPGTMRITMSGAPLNYGSVSASVEITSTPFGLRPSQVFTGRMKRDEVITHAVEVPSDLLALGVRLVWEHDWSTLPTYDLDMVVQAPDGIVLAATLDAPELAWVEHPTGGSWLFHLLDFSTVRGTEPYRLEIVTFAGSEAAPRPSVARPEFLSVTSREHGEAHEIVFATPAAGLVDLEVFDVGGRRARQVAHERLPTGRHALVWNGRDGDGARVSAGVYFVRVSAASGSATRKLVVVR